MLFSKRGLLVLVLTAFVIVKTLAEPVYGLAYFCALFFARDTILDIFPAAYRTLHLPQLIALITLFSWFKNRKKLNMVGGTKPIQFKLMIVFFGVLCLSRISHGLEYGGDKNEAAPTFMKLVVLFFLIVSITNTVKRLEIMMLAYVGTNTVQAFLGLQAWSSGENKMAIPHWYWDYNDFAGYMVSTLPIAFYFMMKARDWPKRAVFGLSCVLLLWCTLGSNSRGGILTMGVLGCIMVLTNPNRKKLIVLLIPVAIFAYIQLERGGDIERIKARLMTVTSYEEDPSAASRLRQWGAALRMFTLNPAMGVGAGQFGEEFLKYLPPELKGKESRHRSIHNMYFQVASETGLMGLIPFLLLLVTSFFNVLFIRRNAPNKDPSDFRGAGTTLGYSLLAFCGCGFFLPNAYLNGMYIVMPMIAALRGIVAQESEAPAVASADDQPSQGILGDGLQHSPVRR